MPSTALASTIARYEKAGYAKLVVVLTCKSHDPGANLAIVHLKKKNWLLPSPYSTAQF
jgi:hypothetical protein